MKNTYRVDRHDNTTLVPCGMNSIRYVGNSLKEAIKTFDSLKPGKDSWEKENKSYGVIISKWSQEKNDYIIFNNKGLN